MGRKKRGRSGGRGGNHGRNKRRNTEKKQDWRDVLVFDNEAFTAFYTSQGIVPKSEWKTFLRALTLKLPTTFRVSEINGRAPFLLSCLRKGDYSDFATGSPTAGLRIVDREITTDKPLPRPPGYVPFMDNRHIHADVGLDLSKVQPGTLDIHDEKTWTQLLCDDSEHKSGGALWDGMPARTIPWYPADMGWQAYCSKRSLRTLPSTRAFRQFLMKEFDLGNVNRQEAVSMIPPLLLDVQPHHFVLDMCAAPGSKTCQLLESLHYPIQWQATKPGVKRPKHTVPSGFIIANDVERKRAMLLTHQLQRYNSPNWMVIKHAGQHIPNLYIPKCLAERSTANVGSSTPQQGAGGERKSGDLSALCIERNPQDGLVQLLFDRILCDVPCTGDGTIRKAPNIWAQWNAGMGVALHPLQTQIAVRGASLLRVGGVMVYSTCSLNPMENESVVAEVLRRFEGRLRVVDVSKRLPQLARRAGLTTWKVYPRTLGTKRPFVPKGKTDPYAFMPEERISGPVASFAEVQRSRKFVHERMVRNRLCYGRHVNVHTRQMLEPYRTPTLESVTSLQGTDTYESRRALMTSVEEEKAGWHQCPFEDPECAYHHHACCVKAGNHDGCGQCACSSLQTLLQDSEIKEADFIPARWEDMQFPRNHPYRDLRASHFPPENAAELGLEHSLRLLPHLQNTGGFFVCVLERTAAEPKKQAVVKGTEPRSKLHFADDMCECPPDNLQAVCERHGIDLEDLYHYGAGERGPTPRLSFLSRAGSSKTNRACLANYTLGFLATTEVNKTLEVIAAGTKVLRRTGGGTAKSDSHIDMVKRSYRLCQDGVRLLAPFASRNRMVVNDALLRQLIKLPYVVIEKVEQLDPEAAKLVPRRVDGENGVQDQCMGSLLIEWTARHSSTPHVLSGWVAVNSITLMCGRPQQQSLLALLGPDPNEQKNGEQGGEGKTDITKTETSASEPL